MKVLITAGPTREPLDPVRYLSNRSSGKMGYALAEAAITLGHEVTLVSGPVQIPPPTLAKVLSVETTREMFEVVQREITMCEIAIFAAAVADYRPLATSAQKIKKNDSTLTLELERTEDILGSARSVFGFTGYLVGFAAETENLIEQAQSKLHRKGCDLIVANDVSQPGIGFDSSENAVTLCYASGEIQTLPQQSKQALAAVLLTQITRLAISSSSTLHV
jgi:phosphopantothenate-cysteine ligase/phosphopantothenoylcysteine decarboxylase/phosphopantothenate--cysteine ligase